MNVNYARFSRRNGIWLILCALTMAMVSGYLIISTWTTPESKLRQARQLLAQPQKALALVRSAIFAKQGNYPTAQLLECQLLMILNRGQDARSLFLQIQHPENCDPEELCHLADQALTAGDSQFAAHCFKAAGDEFIHRSPIRLKRLIFAIYTQPGHEDQEERILKLCQDYARMQADDAFPWLVSASLYQERNVPNLAAEAYQSALLRQLPPEEEIRSRFQLCQLSMLLGNLKLARENCDALLKLPLPTDTQRNVTVLNADLMIHEGKAAEALNVLNGLVKTQPGVARILTLRGACRLQLKDVPGTIDDLSAAVKLDDFDQRAHYLLGQAYLQQKKQVLAEKHLNRSRELNDIMAQIFTLENQLRNDLYNSELKLRLAELNEKRGDREKAAAWRRGATERPTGDKESQQQVTTPGK